MRVACLNYRTDGRIYIGCGEAEHDVMSALQVALISYFPNLERKDLGKELSKEKGKHRLQLPIGLQSFTY